MKEARLEPSEILKLFKKATDTFGTFDFTYVPMKVKEGEDPVDYPENQFWEASAYCACFFPRKASKDANNPDCAQNQTHFMERQEGFREVCMILGCTEEDEVVGICPKL